MQDALEILKQYWGYEGFRPQQEQVIEAVLEGKDTLAILPTGGGKSLCYQVPALAMDGVCIVVTPLVALMKDQVSNLKSRDVKASSISASNSKREIDIILDNCVYGDVKLLYLSPERLNSTLFIERFKKMNVSFVAVDEAHCISEWGHDFRPAYFEIQKLKEYQPDLQFVALTATATPKVKEEIINSLAFRKDYNLIEGSFKRENISLSVFKVDGKEAKVLEILSKVQGTAIMYCNTRKEVKSLTKILFDKGVSVTYYHGGMTYEQRDDHQERWLSGRVRVMVATNAFGMGIDKSNVRMVIHFAPPMSMEAYFQEAGRAGRDGEKSYAVLLYNTSDITQLNDRIKQKYPSSDTVKRVYQALANYYQIASGSFPQESFDFDIADFSSTYHLTVLEVYNALLLLEKVKLVHLNESISRRSRLKFNLSSTDLYKVQVANEQYDLLIKALLRLYGGELFSDFIEIREEEVAKLNKGNVKLVEHLLKNLDKLETVQYEKRKSGSQVMFTQPRLSSDKIDLDSLQILKENDETRLASVEKYLESSSCRAVTIAAYFGEETLPCGKCDVCLEQKRGKVDYRAKVLASIGQEFVAINNVLAFFTMAEKEEVYRVLRELVDEGLVQMEVDKVRLKQK